MRNKETEKQRNTHTPAQTDVEYYGLRFGTVCGASPNLRSDVMLNAMVVDALTHGEVTTPPHPMLTQKSSYPASCNTNRKLRPPL